MYGCDTYEFEEKRSVITRRTQAFHNKTVPKFLRAIFLSMYVILNRKDTWWNCTLRATLRETLFT